MQQTVLFSPHPCLAVWHQGQLSIQQTNLAEVWGLRERSGRFINQPATLNGFPNEVKSLQGLILYHLRGATCSTAIIGKDGTATISRKREGTGTDTEEEKSVWWWWGGDWDEQIWEKRGRETDREETSWRQDKEARHWGVTLMQIMTLSVLRQTQRGREINKIFYKKETRQHRVSYDTAMSIQPLVCASLAAIQDLDSSSSLHLPAVSNLPMC